MSESLPPDLAAFEARLAAISPVPTSANRDELMYRAGWAAAEAALGGEAAEKVSLADREPKPTPDRAAWHWPAATSALSVAIALFAFVQALRRPETAPIPPAKPVEHAAAPAEPLSPLPRGEYLQLRELVIQKGLNGLETPVSIDHGDAPAPPPDYRQIRRDLLGT